jgi:hypothetical protein
MSTTQVQREGSPWAQGVVIAAASLLLMAGLFQIFQGIAAIANDDVFVKFPNYTFEFDTTVWGWIHLVVGVIFVLVAFFLFSGNAFARGAGIGIAVISAVGNFAWLPYYPLWALAVIALDILIIWAIASFEPLT